MRRYLLIAALALLVAVVVFLVRRGGAPRLAPLAGPVVLPRTDEDGIAPDTREVAAGSRMATSVEPGPVAEPTASGACTIEVALVAPAGDDVLDGRSVVLQLGDLGSSRSDSRSLEGITDAQGLCRWTVDGLLDLRSLDIAASDSSPGVSRRLYESLALPGEVKRLEIEVESGAALAGRVVDGDGVPVPGAEVLAWSGESFDPSSVPERTTLADAAGRFELAHLGRPFALVAHADGRVCSRGLRGELPRGRRAEGELELVLLPAWRVSGHVLGARNEPVDALLSVREHGTRSSAFATSVAGVSTFRPAHADAATDAQGRFDLGPLPCKAMNVRVQSDVYGERYVPLPTEPGPWTIRLEDGVVLRGGVLDSSGAPVSGAEVGLDGDGLSSRRTRTSQDGSFEFRGLPELESSYVCVAAAGCAPWLREGLALSLESPPTPILARLEPGFPLAGRVVDGAGRGMVGVRVVLEGERSYERGYSTDAPDTIEHLVDRGEAHTGIDGRFRFEDLYAGEFALRVFPHGERQLYAESRARAGATDLELVLERSDFERVVLTGRVTDAVLGTPVAAFALLAMLETPTGSGGTQREVRDSQGGFRLALPRPVTMHLEVRAPGYAIWSEPMRERGEGEHVYDVRLVRERSLELRFFEADGSPAGGSLAVFDDSGTRLMIGGGLRSSEVRTENGVVRGLGLPASVLRLVLRPGRGRAAEEFTLDLRADLGPVVEFVLAPREPELRPIDLGFLVYGADRDVDVDALLQRMRQEHGLAQLEGCWPLATALSVAILDIDGTELLLGVLEPTPEGVRSRWLNPLDRTASESVLPPAMGCTLSESVPGRARSVRLEAQGYATRSLPIDPSLPNGGVPRLIVLLR